MTQDGWNTLTYDAENRAVTAAGTTYVYDGNGLRVRKCALNCTSPTSSNVYIFSGSKVIAEYANGAAPASPTREYIYSGPRLLAKMEAGATAYFHADHLSERVLTDANGSITGQLAHYPYGESWYGAGITKWQFTTCERDSESGNDFAMARFHVNRLGRFSSVDPIAGSTVSPQSHNRFPYVWNDPVNLNDPEGLAATSGLGPDGSFEPRNYNVFPYTGNSTECHVNGYAIGCGFLSGFLANGSAVVCPYGCNTNTNTILGNSGTARLQYFWLSTNGPGSYYAYFGPGALYYSPDQAAVAFGDLYGEMTEEAVAEYNTNFYRDANGVYSFTDPTVFPCVVVNGGFSCQSFIYPTNVPAGTTPVGTAHTHPDPSPEASPDVIYGGDMAGANQIFGDHPTINILYTVDPWSGRVLSYNAALYNPASTYQCQAISVVRGSPSPSPCIP